MEAHSTSPQLHFNSPAPAAECWSMKEEKLFESLVAEFPEGCASRYESIASGLPGKSVDQVLKHYEDLVADVDAIEAGLVPLPKYADDNIEKSQVEEIVQKAPPKKSKMPESKWTREEQTLFVEGLKKYGKGDWRGISRNVVMTKTPSQVASHAQKYFMRHSKEGQKAKKRSSIHDLIIPPSPSSHGLRNNLQVLHAVVAADSQLADSQPQEHQQQYAQQHQLERPIQPVITSAAAADSQRVAISDLQQPLHQQQQQQQQEAVIQRHQDDQEQFLYDNANGHQGEATDDVDLSLFDLDQQFTDPPLDDQEDIFASMFSDYQKDLNSQLDQQQHTNDVDTN